MELVHRPSHSFAQDLADVGIVELGGARIEVLHAVYRAQTFPRHSHDTYTIGVGLLGIGGIWCRGATHARRQGDIVVIPPGEIHTGGVGPQAGVLSYLAVYVPAQVVSVCAAAEGVHVDAPEFPALVFRDALIGRALRALQCVVPRVSLGGGPETARAQDALALALSMLVRRHGGSRSRSHQVDEPRLVRTVREILHACYADPARSSLESLAAEAAVTPFHLVRAFTRTIGMSPHQYVVQLRIDRARHLLAAGTPPSLVAAMTGFADQSHLTTQFKRHLGITPARYQRCVRAC
jgi:AraC-like DNA-binding protein/quercetin dioxygenase-like cupin family protein